MSQLILIDSSSFPEIRRKGCVYADTTAYLRRLASGSQRTLLSGVSAALRQEVADDLDAEGALRGEA